jgi:hypothetical protein
MNLYPGLWLYKKPSYRLAQVHAVDKDYAYLTWDDNEAQTRVRRERFNRTTEWERHDLRSMEEALAGQSGA